MWPKCGIGAVPHSFGLLEGLRSAYITVPGRLLARVAKRAEFCGANVVDTGGAARLYTPIRRAVRFTARLRAFEAPH